MSGEVFTGGGAEKRTEAEIDSNLGFFVKRLWKTFTFHKKSAIL